MISKRGNVCIKSLSAGILFSLLEKKSYNKGPVMRIRNGLFIIKNLKINIKEKDLLNKNYKSIFHQVFLA